MLQAVAEQRSQSIAAILKDEPRNKNGNQYSNQ